MPGEDYGIKLIFGPILDIIEAECRGLNACEH